MNQKIEAELRTKKPNVVRKSGYIPAVVYGKGETISVQIKGGAPKQNVKHELVYEKDGKEVKETVMVFAMQRYPVGNQVLHIDFLRVTDETEVTIPVTVKFTGQDKSKAIKMEGATLGVALARIRVVCELAKAPKFLEADMSQLKIGQTFYGRDLLLPEGVSLSKDQNGLALATMNKPRGGVKEA